jgi:hypothetical protein
VELRVPPEYQFSEFRRVYMRNGIHAPRATLHAHMPARQKLPLAQEALFSA